MMYLQLVADVDDQRVGHGVDGHPAAVALHLQAGDAVLEQERDGIGVLVPRQPVGELRLRARRVAVEHDLRVPRCQLPQQVPAAGNAQSFQSGSGPRGVQPVRLHRAPKILGPKNF